MVDSPTLDAADRPAGVILPEARCIKWLQSGLNFCLHRFPWAGVVTSTPLTVSAGTVASPTDFILDVRNGLVIPPSKGGPGRLYRRPLQEIITLSIDANPGTPRIYTVHDPDLRVHPAPNKSYAATLWYYKLPPALGPATKPTFPDDWTLIEYVRLRGLEWVRALPVGSAIEYAKKACADLQKTGMGREPEYDTLQLDERRFRGGSGGNRSDWMGEVS